MAGGYIMAKTHSVPIQVYEFVEKMRDIIETVVKDDLIDFFNIGCTMEWCKGNTTLPPVIQSAGQFARICLFSKQFAPVLFFGMACHGMPWHAMPWR